MTLELQTLAIKKQMKRMGVEVEYERKSPFKRILSTFLAYFPIMLGILLIYIRLVVLGIIVIIIGFLLKGYIRRLIKRIRIEVNL